MRIFLSYPRKNKDKAKILKNVLEHGGHRVWMDEALVTGQSWRHQLETQIKNADAIALAITPHWIASSYCQWEFVTATEQNKKVIPVMIETTALPERIAKYQYADFTNGFPRSEVDRFLNNLLVLATSVEPSSVANLERGQYEKKIDSQISITDNNNQVTRFDSVTVNGNFTNFGTQNLHGKIEFQETKKASTNNSPFDAVKEYLRAMQRAIKQESSLQHEDKELINKYLDDMQEEISREVPRVRHLKIAMMALETAIGDISSLQVSVAGMKRQITRLK